MKAKFRTILYKQRSIVCLIDESNIHGSTSITNDAEAVVKHIHSQYGNSRIVYRDTDGNWDELLHNNGVFLDFGLLSKEEKDNISQIE